ncbi:MAG: MFS transporter [Nocardioides sp.]|nr:MFS transporter [Nocardioides sp.]
MTFSSANISHTGPNADPRRWRILALVAVCQLVLALDASIVNIALPAVQEALGVSDAERQWVITAYALTFGGLLLLGGRICDFVGRKRVIIIGLVGFAAVSALGGLAPNAAVLFTARGLQGLFAALIAPAALAILSATFTDPKERATAFGVYGGVSGGGAAIGLIVGGLLTEYTTWRWCLLINVPVTLITAAFALWLITEHRTGGRRYDIPGAITATAGLGLLVFGFSKADEEGWTSPLTLGLLAAAAALLVAFVAIESRTRQPLLPLRVVMNRSRGAAYINGLIAGAALFAVFLFLSYYMQGTLHYSPIKTGLGFLPLALGIGIGAALAGRLLPQIGPRLLTVTGLITAAVGLLLLTRLGTTTGYASHLLPGQLVVAIGTGLVFVTVTSTAMIDIDTADSGIASAMVNTTQQIGGSLGIALLNTIATTSTTHYLTTHRGELPEALVHGFHTAFLATAALLVFGAICAWLMIHANPNDLPAPEPARTRPDGFTPR